MIICSMKPKAYSLRLPFSACEYSCRVLQPGGKFGWQSPHKKLQHGPYTRSCLILRGRAVRQLARFIPWRSQVQILPSLFTWFRTLHPDIPGTRKTSLKKGCLFAFISCSLCGILKEKCRNMEKRKCELIVIVMITKL